MVGYPDGTFQPQGEITRAEAAALFSNLLSQQKGVDIHTVEDAGFSDIPANVWYSGHVWFLNQYGVISGVGNGKFAPNEPITRAEFTAMAVKFFNVYDGGDEDLKEEYAEFTDIAPATGRQNSLKKLPCGGGSPAMRTAPSGEKIPFSVQRPPRWSMGYWAGKRIWIM